MSEPLVIPPRGGELIGDAPDRRVELLSDDDALHATWSRFGPGREGADLHVHRRHTDVFYVLDGELTIRLGPEGQCVAVPAGTLVRVPPLVVHGFRNASDAELRYLNLHAPGRGFADFMRAGRDGRTLAYDQYPPPADGGRPAADAALGDAERLDGGVTLLADVEEIAIAELSSPAERPPAAMHVHRAHVESLYVLAGVLVLTLGDRSLPLRAGSWAQVPAGAAHGVSSPRPVRFLEVHTPGGGFGTFLRTGDAARFDRHPA